MRHDLASAVAVLLLAIRVSATAVTAALVSAARLADLLSPARSAALQ